MRDTILRSTEVAAAPEVVWAHATSMPGIRSEMGPWLVMTSPRAVETLSLAHPDVHLHEPLFSSVILFLGVLPVERMKVTLVELEQGKRFVEQSEVLFLRQWRHERTIEPTKNGTRVTDRVTATPPIDLFAPLMRGMVSMFFAHRHRRLQTLFGAPKHG